MRELLNAQANQIERVLYSHGLAARVYGGTASPRLVQFHLALAPGVKLARLNALADDLALALGAPSCRLQTTGGALNLEVARRPDQAATVRLLPLAAGLPSPPPCTALLGLDEAGVPLLLRLSSPEVAHALICGTTGSGKTELARTMIAGLARANPPERLRLLLVDPKGRAFRPFAALPHLIAPVIAEPQEALDRLAGLVAEMERRDLGRGAEEQGSGGVPLHSFPRIVVFLDELADLLLTGGRPVEHLLTRLVQRGREAGIHLVACTQRPAAVVIGGMIKANFPCRLVGRVMSPEDAKVATGVKGSGAERLQGRGDFLLVAQGQVRRLQVAHVSTEEIGQIVAGYHKESPARPQARLRVLR